MQTYALLFLTPGRVTWLDLLGACIRCSAVCSSTGAELIRLYGAVMKSRREEEEEGEEVNMLQGLSGGQTNEPFIKEEQGK